MWVGDQVYYGSTMTSLKQRYSTHKSMAKLGRVCASGALFQTGEEPKIVELEKVEIEAYSDIRNKLRKREQWYIDNHPDDVTCLNSKRAFRTNEQRLEEVRKRKYIKYHNNSKWRESHKLKAKQRYQNDPEYRERIKKQANLRYTTKKKLIKLQPLVGAAVARACFLRHRTELPRQ